MQRSLDRDDDNTLIQRRQSTQSRNAFGDDVLIGAESIVGQRLPVGDMVERQGSTVIVLEDQLSNDWLGEPGKPESTDLYRAYEQYATFLVEQGRIDKVPDDLVPLINSSYIANYLSSKG